MHSARTTQANTFLNEYFCCDTPFVMSPDWLARVHWLHPSEAKAYLNDLQAKIRPLQRLETSLPMHPNKLSTQKRLSPLRTANAEKAGEKSLPP
jgi:hypothetical protein